MEMDEQQYDHFGFIKMIDIRKGFGFISSDSDNKEYYFNLNSLHEVVQPNDMVAFVTRTRSNRERADAIRKIYTNKSGIKFIPRINRKHIHDGVEPYLPTLYEQITGFDDESIARGIEFPLIVGQSDCVKTDDHDIVFYAIRVGRLGHTRFVINREPEPTNIITIVLRKLSSYYQVISCYKGKPAPYEPWDSHASTDDLEFWCNHALIAYKEDIINESKTYDNPWVLNQPSICKLRYDDF